MTMTLPVIPRDSKTIRVFKAALDQALPQAEKLIEGVAQFTDEQKLIVIDAMRGKCAQFVKDVLGEGSLKAAIRRNAGFPKMPVVPGSSTDNEIVEADY